MRDKRPVDELSIEELERILAIRKREARLARLRRHEALVVVAARAPGPATIAAAVAADPLVPPDQAAAAADRVWSSYQSWRAAS